MAKCLYFTVNTEHKPLVSILMKKNDTSARLERLKFKLQGQSFVEVHLKG